MDLNNVVLGIMNEAEKKAKQILEEGAAERKSILLQCSSTISAKKEEMKMAAEEKIRQLRTRELAAARLAAKKIEMNAKKAALEKAYNTFYGLVKKDGHRMLKNLFESTRGKIDAATVYVSSGDYEQAKKLFHGMKVSEIDIDGGLIVENADKTEKIDLSLLTLAEELRKDTLNDVSKILFSNLAV